MGRAGLHALAGALGLASALSLPAGALDWSDVPGHEIELFHTGQASWEWVLTQSDHSGARKMREGKSCRGCHADEEQKIGELIASGEKLEPEPGGVHRPHVTVTLQAAHDDERLHLRFSWPVGPAGASNESLAVMLDDGSLKEATLGGCWASCHADLPAMPHAAAGGDLTKYVAQSRVKLGRTGGGDAKPPEALQALLEAGSFLELWRVHVKASAEAEDGYVLDERHESPASRIAVEGAPQVAGDRRVVELSVALAARGAGQKALAPGRTYTFGVALHEGDAEGRFHLVSLEHTLALDAGEADVVARRP